MIGYQPIDNLDALQAGFDRIREAQRVFRGYSQEQVDQIFKAAALAANHARIPLAKLAAEETGMGIVEDKVIKNHYAAEYIYNKYKNTKTCGVIEEDASFGIRKIAEPLGVVAAVIPATNPTSTAIFKILLALKTRNGMLISPPPRAKKAVVETAKLLLNAAVKAGAPEGIIAWIESPSLELTNGAMQGADCILATGGPGMVKAAYSSGKPAIGVGPGNTPVIIDSTADIKMSVNSVILSKTFDNGMICASEQAVIVAEDIYAEVKQEFVSRGAHILTTAEADKVRKILVIDGKLNTRIVGQTAKTIAEIANVKVAAHTKLLVGEVKSTETSEPFALEKLSPVLAMYKSKSFDTALDTALSLIGNHGMGHTASIFTDIALGAENVKRFQLAMPACRILVNSPASHGAIGDLFNFKLEPSLTLGCGSWGINSVSENVGVKHLLNIKTVAERRENMLWFRAPQKLYYKRGCLPVALDELNTVLDKKKVFIVTDTFLFTNGHITPVTDKLNELGISYTVFYDVEPDPTLACIRQGAAEMALFEPDCILSVGGGSPMDAAKIMWLMYEHPDADFHDMAMRFMDIRKRVYPFPKMGEKAYFIAVPTTAGTGSEVTPFAVITDEQTDTKYPIADYELLPHMAIVDADLMMHMPPSLTAASGIDVLTHAMEAYASMLATPYTDGLAKEALKLTFTYLQRAYDNGAKDPEAREQMANASTIAGMAFANAFLGVCHSMAHKLGAAFELPHGVANALMMVETIRFNAATCPAKMGTFPQYTHPIAGKKYAELSDMLELGGKTEAQKVEKLIDEVNKLKAALGIKPAIKDYGIKEADFEAKLDEMSEMAFDDQCTGANPRYPLIAEIKEMYRNAYHGK